MLRSAGFLIFAMLLAGCGYHVAGSATHIPADVRTLAVPIFVNDTQSYHTEVALTDAVVHELNTRTKYRIVSTDKSADADAMLRGTVVSENIAPLTYDVTTGQSSSFLVTITAKVVLTANDGHVLYQNSNYTFRQQYQSTQDLASFIQEDSPAVKRLSRDFAQSLVSDMLESF